MAQYQENQQTIGKAKNSKVYVAKGANSFEVNGEHQREFPSREAVMQMKSFFEKTHSDNNSVDKSDQVLPVLNGNAETLFQSHESLRGTGISEYSFETQTSFPGRKTGSNDSLSNSETKSSVHINTIKDSSEININEGQVAKPIRPAGSMLLQPASNVRGPMVKAEYLKLNKFNDITVYSGSGQKRGMVSVDELDRKIDENSAIAFVVLADNSFSDDPDELLLSFDSDYVVEFEGAGLTIGRSTLKASKSLEREKVRRSVAPCRPNSVASCSNGDCVYGLLLIMPKKISRIEIFETLFGKIDGSIV